MERGGIDESFLNLPLRSMADAALSEARALGAEHADFRCGRLRQAHLRTRDGKRVDAEDRSDTGVAVRVVHDGTWGFAAGTDQTPTDAAMLARRAVEVARVSRPLTKERVELADEPVYRDVKWLSAYEVNPFDVPESDRLAILAGWSERLLAAREIDHVYIKLRAAQENKFYADLAGTVTTQQRVCIYPQITVLSVTATDGSSQQMRSLAPAAGRGWEYLHGTGWDWNAELTSLPEMLAEKKAAPPVEPGQYDLVIDSTNLWLTIHESIGHATELDRVLGYEAAYAGTSFATFEQLGTLQYGSPVMNVSGDRTVEHGLATIGYDDDGVAAQSWDIIRDGVLVGYQLDRQMARLKGFSRSTGCAYADSLGHVALQRMPNVSLQPAAGGPSIQGLIGGVERGIYVVGDNSYSIDMQRCNFQFTGQRFHKIENGRLTGQVADVAYGGVTTQFWGSLEALGGPETYLLSGADRCGKAQPGQLAPVSHGCPAALFRNVSVLRVGNVL